MGTSRSWHPDRLSRLSTYYLKLCDYGLIESQRRLEEYFRDGKIGTIVSGGWLLQRLKKTPPKFEYKIGTFFTPSGDTGMSFFGGEYLAIYKNSPRKEAADKIGRIFMPQGKLPAPLRCRRIWISAICRYINSRFQCRRRGSSITSFPVKSSDTDLGRYRAGYRGCYRSRHVQTWDSRGNLD